jgi:hypothetical protein
MEVQMFKRIAGIAAVGGVAVFGIGSIDNTTRNDQGEIVESGELGAFVTQVGDCFFELPQNSEGVSTVPGVPCADAHHWQVVHKENISLTEFSNSNVSTLAEQLCDNALKVIASNLSYDKQLEYQNAATTGLQPTEGSWVKGDRMVDCLVGSDNEIYYTSILD